MESESTTNMFHPINKPWGKTFRLPPDGRTHYAIIKKGGKSSWHYHPRSCNGFFVVSGKLKIKQEIGDTVILCTGDFLAVEAGNKHSFEAMADTHLIETYGADDDIVRVRDLT